MNRRVPKFHRDFKIADQVNTALDMSGKIIGIATMDVVFTYIVLLDKPIETEYGTQFAVVLPGSELMMGLKEYF